MVVFPENDRTSGLLAHRIMPRLLLTALALLLAPALPAWHTAGLVEIASAQDLQRPRGVTPTVDSEDEPEDQRLSIEFNRRFQDLRSGSPLSIDWTLKWQGSRLPKGHLDVHIIQGRRIRGRLLSSREIVLTETGTRFRTLLPPFNTDSDPFSTLDIRAYFISDDGTFPLGERSLRVGGPLSRSFVVAFCEPWQKTSSPEELKFTNSINVANMVQRAFGQPGSANRQRLVATYPARIYPADVPSDPLWLCEFNMLVLLPDGLRDLRRNQCQAIAQWVDAGGSLCIFLDGSLTSVHAEFINRLARSQPQHPRLELDGNGKPRLTESPARLHKGLGRVVIHQDLPLDLEFVASQQWQTSVEFLWNQLHEIRSLAPQPAPSPQGLLPGIDPAQLQPVPPPSPDPLGPLGPPGSRQPAPTPATLLAAASQVALQRELKWKLNSVNSLVHRLTPDDFEVVPMWLLGLLLLGYVVVIGPVDYVVLGWLKMRKWTWVVFPATTVAFTVLIIWVSHEYMGTSGSARQVLFRDIGDNGELVRENRFELHLAGSHKKLVTRVQRGLFTPIDHRRYLSNNQLYINRMPGSGLALAEPPEYIGTIPTEYTAVQDLPQWSPQLNRIFRIAPDDPVPTFDWDAVEPEVLAKPGEARARFQAAVLLSFGSQSGAVLFHGHLPEQPLWNTPIPLFPQNAEAWQLKRARAVTWTMQVATSPQSAGFFRDSCVRPSMGVFRAISRVAPHGGDNFEDLALLDPTDPGQWLLVIAVADGDSLVLYRHLYHDRPTNHTDPLTPPTTTTSSR